MERGENLPEELCTGIDRLVELFVLEGRSPVQVPEQFAAYLAAELATGWESLPDSGYSIEKYLDTVKEINRTWRDTLENVHMNFSAQIYRELSGVLLQVHKAYPQLTLKDCSRLGELFEYLLKAVFIRGNKACFFTPVNIARLLVGLAEPGTGETVWDPACGSGTLLTQVIKENTGSKRGLELLGYDTDEQMVRLTKLNLFFHGISSAQVVQQDSLKELCTADVILANPPVISGFGVHLDFLRMIPQSLLRGGRAAVLINEGFLFGKHAAEREIRENLVERYGLRAVISLPEGVFAPYTSAKSSVLVFGDRQESREPVLFYEIRQVGYTRDKKCTPIKQNDIPDAIAVYRSRAWHYEEWAEAMRGETTYNVNGIRVPTAWEEPFWFAERELIRENQCILWADQYKPVTREEPGQQEDIGDLMRQLGELEQETEKGLRELAELFERQGLL
ncbi:MAG: N-6 DNA methylase [Lachnospiraceae bacterium]|nr:N-6 DNA methylase [Lachnospiraceae bacterium]